MHFSDGGLKKSLHTIYAGFLIFGLLLLLPVEGLASEKRELILHSAVGDWRAILCLIVFFLSYLLVMTEEQTHLRK